MDGDADDALEDLEGDDAAATEGVVGEDCMGGFEENDAFGTDRFEEGDAGVKLLLRNGNCGRNRKLRVLFSA